MRVSLVHAPGADPRSPHLALPSLTATLRRAGVTVTPRDCDIEGLLWAIAPVRVHAAIEACIAEVTAGTDPQRQARLLAALAWAECVIDGIAGAPAALRDPGQFFAPYRLLAARECIVRALDLVSAAAGPVHYNTGPIEYRVEGVDPSKLRDLIRATEVGAPGIFGDYYEDVVLPAIAAERPDVVGVSILNGQQLLPGLTLARRLKERGHFVVLGGTLLSKFAAELGRRPQFFRTFCDGVVVYEGETALLDLLDRLAGDRDLSRVPNLLSLQGDRVIAGPHHAEDVNSLPTPDFAGMPLADYLAPAPVLPILTGKGCYFNRCKFCDIPYINHVAGKAYRVRRPELVAEDVATLHARHGTRYFEITDEALAPKLLLQLAEALEGRREVAPRFVGYARLEPGFTPAVCRRLHDAGIRKLFFGLESGSQRMLDHMDKGIDVADVAPVLRACTDAGIAFHLFSIVGFPEETEADARETLRFFLEHRPLLAPPQHSFDVHPFMLDLRTDYSAHARRYGAEVDVVQLSGRDFPLSVEAWDNTRGLGRAAAEALVVEFTATLRAAYPDHRSFPVHLWPGFEEYSLLYCERFAGGAFPWRLALPPDGDPRALRLRWSASVRFEPTDDAGALSVRCMTGRTTTARAAVVLLAQLPEAGPVDAVLAALLARLPLAAEQAEAARAGVRRVVDELLAVGALELHLTPEEEAA